VWSVGAVILALGTPARAQAPTEALRPILAPWDAPTKWSAYLEGKGASPDPLACDALVDDQVRLCLRVREGDRLRWVTTGDLERWSLSLEQAVGLVREASTTHLSDARPVQVVDMNHEFLQLVDGEGWAASLALQPDRVARMLGPDTRFAFPAGTVALAWRAGDGELDKVMAVGVVELAEEQPGEVTRTVFRWDGKGFVPYAEAKLPAVDAPKEQQSPATQ